MASTPDGVRTCDKCGKPNLSNTGWSRHRPKGLQSGICLKDAASNKYRTVTTAVPTAPAILLADIVATPSVPTEANELSAYLRSLRQSNRLLRRIPKSSRPSVAESLIRVLDDCIRTNDFPSWRQLLTFAYGALSLPDETDEKMPLSTLVRQNLGRTGDFLSLAKKPSSRKSSKTSDSKLRSAVKRKMQDGNVSGAVRLLSSEEAVAPFSAEVLAALRLKHPAAHDDADYPPAPTSVDPTPEPITPSEVLQAINSFPNGSSAGLDGLSPQHLKDLVGASAGEIAVRLCERLAALLNVMTSGSIPLDVCPLLYGACLTALLKKDGGIRPIAVGTTIRRMLGRILSRRAMMAMGALMRPVQLGYGTRGGAEAVVHATRSFISVGGETRVLLKMDFKNAFNTIRRDRLLHAVKLHLPHLYPLVWQMYRTPSKLLFGDAWLSSECGVQQGDPLGPLLFCLVTRDLSRSMQSPLNSWYLDDATVSGAMNVVVEDLRRVQRMSVWSSTWGNVKAFVYGGDLESRAAATDAMRHFESTLKFPTPAELDLLGAPLHSAGIGVAIEKRTTAISLLTSRLPLLSAHLSLILLKNCLAVPKVLYTLRTSPRGRDLTNWWSWTPSSERVCPPSQTLTCPTAYGDKLPSQSAGEV
ncbi:hypothetical protein BV898_03354 [Hypsibius exemplaris]|uniref:Reverse transcriptase domain-containing protein n=1 Tax=Hypsibius exemplaris TaxID=2072580 RepID=A0A1W0X6D1_HYPEX|nr:hypothetical protein BV898_03354 [Hypsibius exemplaris]